jgi:hypothetical protein
MTRDRQKAKIAYGDFQTPIALAESVCQKLVELDVNPDLIIEPTCGVGNFIDAASRIFKPTTQIIGIEINPAYLQESRNKTNWLRDSEGTREAARRIEIQQGDFFELDWSSLVDPVRKKILVLGNFPWVTNSQQGRIGGINLPQKNNFQNHSGLDAITGKSNFDISEWMLIKVVNWLQNYDGYLAMLCKTSVARKLLNYIRAKQLNLAASAMYEIDAKKYFGTMVDACLFFCRFKLDFRIYLCDVFKSLESSIYYRIGYHHKTLVRDLESFKKVSSLLDEQSTKKWRSGVKHDCSSVMEFRRVNNVLIDGFGKVADIEDIYLFPLLKGTDVAKGRTEQTERYVLLTQRNIGDTTVNIKEFAPKTWNYLECNSKYLDSRKSKIYRNSPRFSVFGVGNYTFKPWKIAICGLYKKLEFRLIGEIGNKPTIFDDTVYFLSFDDENLARKTFELLTAQTALSFYSSLIFWDEKRPIKTSILNRLDLAALEKLNLSNPDLSFDATQMLP